MAWHAVKQAGRAAASQMTCLDVTAAAAAPPPRAAGRSGRHGRPGRSPVSAVTLVTFACMRRAARMRTASERVFVGAPQNSDLDVVVLGVGAHLARPGTGFERAERERLRGLLTALLGRLAGRGVLAGAPLLIGNARVPIIKCRLAGAGAGAGAGGGGGGGRSRSVAVDISLGVANGAAAVAWVAGAAAAVPALRPLVLVVKALLKQWRLNEVFKGGLSSCAPVSCRRLLLVGVQVAAGSTSGAVHSRRGCPSAWAVLAPACAPTCARMQLHELGCSCQSGRAP
jgi:hypothetical protein